MAWRWPLSLPASLLHRDLLEVMAFGVVLFTLLGQGTTIQFLLKRLGLAERPEHIVARERRAPLIFFFVVDTNFTQPANEALAEALADELEQLGRRLLCIAQARAHDQGVPADMVIRHGTLREAIENFLREVNASTLVLGAPQAGSETRAFAPSEIPQFAHDIRAATGIEVLVVE